MPAQPVDSQPEASPSSCGHPAWSNAEQQVRLLINMKGGSQHTNTAWPTDGVLRRLLRGVTAPSAAV